MIDLVYFFISGWQDEENAKAMTLFEGVVKLNDAIEDDTKRTENLVRGILAGNIFDLGSAKVHFGQLELELGLVLQLED